MTERRGRSTPQEPVAIIGMGCLFPKADGLEAYWANICAGVDAITDVPSTHWRPEDYFDSDPKRPDFTYGRRGGFISPFEFDPLKYGIPPNVIEATDTAQLLAMAVADRALTDAGYGSGKTYDRSRVSVILGVTGALELVIPLGARLGHPIWRKALKESGLDDATINDAVRRIADGYVDWQENSFPGLLGNVVAGRVSKHLDLGGTNCVVDAACASSLSAVHLAALELQTGKADMVVSGGVDTFNDIFMYMCFSKTPALSPTGNAKPFDHEGDGTILGEGLGMLVLKRLDDAQRDGDRVYAVIKGIGSSSDGKGEAIYAPNAAGQQGALREAYKNAGVTPDSIELVEAHGTGTKRGDAVEVSALRSVYGQTNDRGPWCALGSVKSQIGHTKAAAGAAGLIKAAMALHDKVLPPTIKVEQPQEAVAPGETPFYINTVKRPWLGKAGHPRRAGVSSFGFGGSNFHCVLEESSPVKACVTWDPRVTIVAFSADSRAALLKKLPDASALEKWDDVRAFAKQSRDSFDSSSAHRLLIVLEQGAEVSRTFTSIYAALESADAEPRMPKGVYYGHGTDSGKLAVLFPGQGAQYVGMLRDLVCAFPEMLDTLREGEEVYQASPQNSGLFDRIYPHPVFDKDSARKLEDALRATQVAQPAIGAVSAGALRVLERFGIVPEAVAGHSYGELVALHAGGIISTPDLFRVSEARGRLMAQGAGDRGSMFAVRAPIAQIEIALREEGLDLVIANRNAPDQAVLSGATSEIERAKAAFKKRGMQGAQLPVAAAFHSQFVADASGPFNDELATLEFGAARVPVYSNTTGGVYPNDPESARGMLAGQLAKPVEFVREVESMHAAGFSTFIEAGPGARLTGLVRSILEGKPHASIALDVSNGKSNGMADLANSLAQIAALGHPVCLAEWDADFVATAPAKPGRMTVTISGANYRAQRKSLPPRTISPALARREVEAFGEDEAPVEPRAISPNSSSNKSPIRPIALPAPPRGSAASFDQTQRNIAALRNMQEQTAVLHKQFLEGQEKALEMFRALVSRQRGAAPAAPPTNAPTVRAVLAPAPVATAPVSEFDLPADSGPSIVEELTVVIKEVVSDKTGYPTNMLELSMTLDSDLGIDSIKRVEILSALQERLPHLPSIEADDLGRIRTLEDVVDRLVRDLPAVSSGVVATPAPSAGVRSKLLQIVSEKTGYPVEMLEPDMALDADLGIDSIKRVEILSALQEAMPNLPQVEPDELGRFVTLADVIARLGQKGAASTPEMPVAFSPRATVGSRPALQIAPQAPDASLAERLLQIVSDKTGYPPNMLELSMGLDADLGIDSIKRVEILSSLQDALPQLPSLDAEAAGRLRTLQDVIDALSRAGNPSSFMAAPKPQHVVLASSSVARYVLEVSELPQRPDAPSVPLQSDAVFWVSDDGTEFSRVIAAHLRSMEVRAELVTADSVEQLDSASRLDGLVLVAPESAVNVGHVRSAFSLLQRAAKKLRAKSCPTPLLVAVTRMDGAFGLGAGPARSCAMSAAFAGLVKTARHEWPEVRCRVIDVGNGYTSVDEAAKDAVKEALADGPIETGLDAGRRVALTLAPAGSLVAASARFGADDVIVITGGARGVTAECAIALAEAYRCKLALFGRGSVPKNENPSYAGIDDASELKRRILAHVGAMTPKELETKYREILAQREIRSTLERIREAGGRPSYFSVDVRDVAAVRDTLACVRKDCGPITGLVHGAGVLADRLIEDKTLEQFDFVFDTKTAGLDSLLSALKTDSLKAIALFSSSTARFGRKGQCDYAAANEALNKIAQAEARSRPGVRVVSLNWGPWDGGMVSPALRGLFTSEGVSLIGVREGANLLVCELGAPASGPVEIVVLGEGSRVPDELTRADVADHSTIQFALSAEAFPFLESHVIDGKAVLPVSLYIEWFAHAALHANPGLRFEGLEGLAVLKGIILQPDESRALEFRVGRVRRDGSRSSVSVELWSRRSDSEPMLHAKADVLLSEKLERGQPALDVLDLPAYKSGRGIYGKGRLFHGRHFQGIRDVEGCGEHGISGVAGSAPRPGAWIADPMRRSWLTEPLVIDCAFQLMILWSYDQFGHGSLPVRVGRYRQFQRGFPKGPVRVVVRVKNRREHKAVSDIEFLDAGAGTLLARIEDYECVIDGALDRAFANNHIAGTPA